MAASHICKACPSAYKVFSLGARDAYMLNNTGHGTTLRPLKRRQSFQLTMLCR